MCSGLLFNYLEIYVPFNVHINENESMNAQWVLSPLSLSFSLAFSSPLSTTIVVPTLLQIPLQPFSSIHSIMGSLYIYIYITWLICILLRKNLLCFRVFYEKPRWIFLRGFVWFFVWFDDFDWYWVSPLYILMKYLNLF